MKGYRTGFLLAVIGNIALAAILVGVWWHYRAPEPAVNAGPNMMAPAIAQDSTEGSTSAAAVMPDAPMTPVQISAQRLQSIGVKSAAVAR